MTEETKHLYYQIDLENMPVEWDTTICVDLDEVRGILQYLEIHFDDPTIDAKATIRGIGMTRSAYEKWKEENLEN
jgi:hypothetical protein